MSKRVRSITYEQALSNITELMLFIDDDFCELIEAHRCRRLVVMEQSVRKLSDRLERLRRLLHDINSNPHEERSSYDGKES